MICDKDCFHCPYPDCINDCMDHEDYVEAAERERELRSTPKKRKLAAQHRAYREANRTEIAAKQKALRDTRTALGISQRKAAEILGVAKSTVSLWENGNVPCDTTAVVLALRSAIQEKPPAKRQLHRRHQKRHL